MVVRKNTSRTRKASIIDFVPLPSFAFFAMRYLQANLFEFAFTVSALHL